MQAFIYLIGNLFLACMTGLVFINIMEQHELPSICKFFVGFSLHPYLIGIYMLLITVIPFRMPNIVYVMIPYLVILLLIVANKQTRIYDLSQMKKALIDVKEEFLEILGIGFISSLLYGVAIIKTLSIVGFLFVLCFAGILFFLYIKILQKRFDISIPRNDFILDETSIILVLLASKIYYCSIPYLPSMTILLLFACFSLFVGWKTVDISKNESQNKKAIMRTGLMLIFSFVCFLRRTTIITFSKITSYLGIPFYPLWTTVGAIFIIGLVLIIAIKLKAQFFSFFLRGSRFVIIFISLIVLFIIIRFIMIRGITIVSGSDAIQYLSEAYEYSQKMEFGSMNDFHGNESGTLLSNIHNPIWPAYLANGLLYAREIGYPFDYGARMAFSMTYLYMIGAIFALGYIFRGCFAGVLSCILLFLYKHFNSIILNCSRDGFRIIPLVVFCIILLGGGKNRSIKNICLSIWIGFLITAGHPINAITAVCIAVAYILWVIITQRIFPLKQFFSLIPFGIGAILGSYQIIWAYLETGSLTGGLIDFHRWPPRTLSRMWPE